MRLMRILPGDIVTLNADRYGVGVRCDLWARAGADAYGADKIAATIDGREICFVIASISCGQDAWGLKKNYLLVLTGDKMGWARTRAFKVIS